MGLWLNGVKQENIIVGKKFLKGNVAVVMVIVVLLTEKIVMLAWNWIFQGLAYNPDI